MVTAHFTEKKSLTLGTFHVILWIIFTILFMQQMLEAIFPFIIVVFLHFVSFVYEREKTFYYFFPFVITAICGGYLNVADWTGCASNEEIANLGISFLNTCFMTGSKTKYIVLGLFLCPVLSEVTFLVELLYKDKKNKLKYDKIDRKLSTIKQRTESYQNWIKTFASNFFEIATQGQNLNGHQRITIYVVQNGEPTFRALDRKGTDDSTNSLNRKELKKEGIIKEIYDSNSLKIYQAKIDFWDQVEHANFRGRRRQQTFRNSFPDFPLPEDLKVLKHMRMKSLFYCGATFRLNSAVVGILVFESTHIPSPNEIGEIKTNILSIVRNESYTPFEMILSNWSLFYD